MMLTSDINTLSYQPEKCINCNRCIQVCPHNVFTSGEKYISIHNHDDCMECGACQVNCPTEALLVDSGVGCAAAMIFSAVTGKDVSCGGDEDEDDSCCGPSTKSTRNCC
jgi:ferredoxin